MRRAIMSALLLLLVFVPVFAGACTVRCAVMKMAGVRNSMPGMTSCSGMSDHSVIYSGAVLSASTTCATAICQINLVLLQSRMNHEIGTPQLGAFAPVDLEAYAVPLLQNNRLLRFSVDRSTHFISPPDPLISSLRI
jgi:hypothetical protein